MTSKQAPIRAFNFGRNLITNRWLNELGHFHMCHLSLCIQRWAWCPGKPFCEKSHVLGWHFKIWIWCWIKMALLWLYLCGTGGCGVSGIWQHPMQIWWPCNRCVTWIQWLIRVTFLIGKLGDSETQWLLHEQDLAALRVDCSCNDMCFPVIFAILKD